MADTKTAPSPGLARAGLALLVVGVALLALLLLFDPFLRRHDVVNRDFAGWLGLACLALSPVFGGLSWGSQLGKVVCVMGGILAAALLGWFFFSGGTAQSSRDRVIFPQGGRPPVARPGPK